MQLMIRLLCLLFVNVTFTGSIMLSAQSISGRVQDKDTQEGIPFCNVYFQGTTIGATTDIDGFYTIQNTGNFDTLVVSAIGYGKTIELINGRESINFYITSKSQDLQEVVVLAGENPAIAIVKGIIKNRDKNTLEKVYHYQLERYRKIELDIDNINEEFKDSKLLKPFDFIFDNIDSVSEEKPFLPFYVTEELHDLHYNLNDKNLKEIPKAHKVSGVNNKTVIDLIGDMYAKFDLYDNQFLILGKAFAAPFSKFGLINYEYYIIDSTLIDGQKSYKLKFKPKRSGEKTFYGEFWVLDRSYAVQRLDMRMTEGVNINLVDRIVFYQENELIQDSFYVPRRRKLIIDFNAEDDAPGLIGRRTESFKKYTISRDPLLDYQAVEVPDYVDLESLERDTQYWQEVRHEKLTKSEQQVYTMIDSLKSVPLYTTYVDMINFFITGYVSVGKLELGTLFGIYSFNQIEGHRPALYARTTSNFSKKLRLSGGLAYGFRDQVLKPTLGLLYIPKKYPRQEFEMRYKEAIDFSSSSSEDIVEGNLFANLYRRPIYQKLLHVREFKAAYEQFFPKGFSGRISVLWRDLDPYGDLEDGNGFNYRYYGNADNESEYDTTLIASEINFKIRYAYKEQFLDGNFSRTSIGSRYPILELQYTRGLSGVLNGQYDYHKLTFAASHWFNIGTVGWFQYKLKAGKIFSTLPFLLAEVHQGNETYFYSPNAYNGMNKYAFASDEYVSIHLQHHFEGYFLNRIPLLKKLQLREVIEFRAVWGRMSNENLRANGYNLFDEEKDFKETYNGFRTLDQTPYMELSYGIENILKVFRVDFIYRLNYLDMEQASRFNVRAGFQFYL